MSYGRLKFLAALAALSALALFAQQVHETEPPAVYRTTVTGKLGSIGHCYNLPSPPGATALYCDVKSPATGKDYGVVIVVPGGISIQR